MQHNHTWICSLVYPHGGVLLWVQKLRSPLLRAQSQQKISLLKPREGQNIALHASPTARNFSLSNFDLPGLFNIIFSKSSLLSSSFLAHISRHWIASSPPGSSPAVTVSCLIQRSHTWMCSMVEEKLPGGKVPVWLKAVYRYLVGRRGQRTMSQERVYLLNIQHLVNGNGHVRVKQKAQNHKKKCW